MAASDPEGAAVMLRLLLAHMASTSKRLMLAMVLDRVDAEDLGTFKPTNSQDCKVLQKPETGLQKGESSALTFSSNPACRGLQTPAGESKNPGPD